jgi:hypothetical protein
MEKPTLSKAKRHVAGWLLLGAVCASAPVHCADYDPAHCRAIDGTLNIFWEGVAGSAAPCTGIEFTDGTFADVADGNFTMNGVSVSNPACIAIAAYAFTLSADKTMLVGSDTFNDVPMTLTRGAGESCFVGHWLLGPADYVATISAVAAGDPIFADGFE